jgi:uroporphyrinogen decarboxylase
MNDARADFDGLCVAAFESRRCDDMARIIAKHGGLASVSPSMQERPLGQNEEVIDFAHRLVTGEITIVLFLTGVGFRKMLEIVRQRVDRDRFVHALSDIVTVARGPKPAAAMIEAGVTPTHRVDEPHTWRELLSLVDERIAVSGQIVAVQEYGKNNSSLTAGLEARGAEVLPVRIYAWDLPEDMGPLEANARAIAEGRVDVVLFTSAQQLQHLLLAAKRLKIEESLRAGLSAAVVGSIGPTTSEELLREHIPVDITPTHPKMGQLVKAAAENAASVIARKERVFTMMNGPASDPTDEQAPWYDSPFMRACRREPVEVTPVWLMRQAGRYMSEYREVRAKTTFLELCKNPELCSEVMVTAVERLGVDAAIIFSDILPLLEPLGLELEYAEGEGPIIHNPVRGAADVDRIGELESMAPMEFVAETVRCTRRDLADDLPVIGFSGAPFTLASYAIEGGASRNYLNTKSLMLGDEGAWNSLMQKLARAISIYLNAQIQAGAQCVQLFDSWAGCLSPDDYRRYVLPHVQFIIASLPKQTPIINFATGNSSLLPLIAEGGSSIVGVDWRERLDVAWRVVGHDKAVQGNLDPTTLLGDLPTIRERVTEVLSQAAGRPGHIFNLGHGILKETPVDNAIAMVDMVHELSAR